MTDELARSSPRSVFASLNRVRIGLLSPSSDSIARSFIDGDIALIWPFSSATGELSILLADQDVRLRKSKGQVKITFHDACARQVASSKLGIGDTIRLGLAGAEWINTGDVVSTPGKKLEWDLCYASRLILEICRGSLQIAAVDFQKSSGKDIPNGLSGGSLDLATPAPSRIHNRRSGGFAATLSSPIFSIHKTQSPGSFIDASLDPFAEDDGFVLGHGRKRTKFARHSGTWKLQDDETVDQSIIGVQNADGANKLGDDVEYVSETGLGRQTGGQSPFDQVDGHEPEVVDISPRPSPLRSIEPSIPEILEISSSSSSAEDSEPDERRNELNGVSEYTAVMAPPETPLRRRPDTWTTLLPSQATESIATTTPRLHPLPSPGLPLVSPLISHHGRASGYFPDLAPPISELDASGTEAEPHSETDKGIHDQTLDFPLSTPSSFSNRLLETTLNVNSDSQPEGIEDLSTIQTPITVEHEVFDKDMQNEYSLPPGSTSRSKWTAERLQVLDPPGNEWKHSFPRAKLSDDLLDHGSNLAEDDDMYGPSEPPINLDRDNFETSNLDLTTELAVTELRPQWSATQHPLSSIIHDSSDWHEKLRISAFDCQTQQPVNPPPFPFIQGWGRSSNTSRRSSINPRSFDGAGDEIDPEEPLSYQSGSEETSLPSDTGRDSAEMLPEEVWPSPSAEQEDETSLGSPRLQKYGSPLETLVKGQVLALEGRNFVEKRVSLIDAGNLNDAQTIPRQEQQPLFTPVNTQPDTQDGTVELIESRPEPVMPPTPEITQPAVESPLPESSFKQVEPDLDDATTIEDAPTLPRLSSETRRTSQRLSRKSLPSENISTLSNPYFTPRRSVRMQSQPALASARKENLPSPKPDSPVLPSKSSSKSSSRKLPSATSPEIMDEVRSPTFSQRPSGLRTPLTYFTPLVTISEHFAQSIDILAVCPNDSTDPQRAEFGPKDYCSTLQLADSSINADNLVIAQIFRPSKSALPAAKSGDVVLLRNFKVQSQKRKCMLLSTDSSAWAVFSHPAHTYTSASLLGVKNAGPPVEYGPEECSRAIELMQWWDEVRMKRMPLGHQQKSTRGTPDLEQRPWSPIKTLPVARSRKRHGGSTEDSSELATSPSTQAPPTRSNNRRKSNYTDNMSNGSDYHPLSPARPPPSAPRRKSDASALSLPPGRRRSSRRSESVVHELRDGVTYVDE